jgi:hypothetical protein
MRTLTMKEEKRHGASLLIIFIAKNARRCRLFINSLEAIGSPDFLAGSTMIFRWDKASLAYGRLEKLCHQLERMPR